MLGYKDGRTIVNDMGIVPIIKNHFAQEFSEYAFESITVTRNAMRLIWEVKGVCAGFVLTATFSKEYLESKYQIIYKLP